MPFTLIEADRIHRVISIVLFRLNAAGCLKPQLNLTSSLKPCSAIGHIYRAAFILLDSVGPQTLRKWNLSRRGFLRFMRHVARSDDERAKEQSKRIESQYLEQIHVGRFSDQCADT